MSWLFLFFSRYFIEISVAWAFLLSCSWFIFYKGLNPLVVIITQAIVCFVWCKWKKTNNDN